MGDGEVGFTLLVATQFAFLILCKCSSPTSNPIYLYNLILTYCIDTELRKTRRYFQGESPFSYHTEQSHLNPPPPENHIVISLHLHLNL